jgi:Asp-tRNA(Asn)/Glu-tRNA(Gln) amidotransferase C subunit
MADQRRVDAAALLRSALARRGIALSDDDLAASAEQLAGVLRAIERFGELDVSGYEPTAYTRFDEEESGHHA